MPLSAGPPPNSILTESASSVDPPACKAALIATKSPFLAAMYTFSGGARTHLYIGRWAGRHSQGNIDDANDIETTVMDTASAHDAGCKSARAIQVLPEGRADTWTE